MSAVRYVRAYLEGGANPYGEGPCRVAFDLLLNDQDVVSGRHPCFGVWGPPVGQFTYPIVLRPDHSVDFGETNEEDERLGVSNIRQRTIRVGEYVTFWASERAKEREEGYQLRITKVVEGTDLAKS